MDVRISAEKSISKAANILIRSTNWIGDAVMTLPAVAAVRNTFPGARITILVKPWVADIFRLCRDIDDIMLYERPGIHDGPAGFWRLTAELRKREFDAAILLQNAIEAAIIAFLAGIPMRAGYNSDGRGLLLTHSVQRTTAIRKVHQSDYYLEMVKALGCRPTGREAVLTLGKDDERLAGELLAGHGLQDNCLLVGMAPGATYGPAKKWFPERFSSVADKLVDGFSAQIFLFGSSEDKSTAAIVQARAKYPMLDLTGKTGLKEAMALMGRCRLFISNDSGLMHVAAALGVPTIAIFGSTNPATTSPAGRNHIIIHKDVACSPCLKPDCPTDFRCMDLIGVDDVYEAAVRLLGQGT
jgi:heptosyltransferase-2